MTKKNNPNHTNSQALKSEFEKAVADYRDLIYDKFFDGKRSEDSSKPVIEKIETVFAKAKTQVVKDALLLILLEGLIGHPGNDARYSHWKQKCAFDLYDKLKSKKNVKKQTTPQ